MTVRKLASDKEVVPSAPADDLSEVESIHSNAQSLQDEPLPSYADVAPEASTTPQVPEKPGQQQGPTASSPFNFPQDELPSYEATIDIKRPLAIPQVFPTQAAPLLAAYPPELLSYGIPESSWYSFVDTVSAFLSADVSKQALHHAAEVANKVKEYHTAYAQGVVQQAKHIGKNAKNFNIFGVVGGTLGLVFGTVGHAVGTVVSTPLTKAITSKPKTPRERATVYVATANQDWFHARGLHALLVDTNELCAVIGVDIKLFREALNGEDVGDAAELMISLRQWIADVEVLQLKPGAAQVPSQPAWTMMGQTNNDASSSKVKAAASGAPRLQLSANTLWLVVIQEKKAQELLAELSPETT